MPPDSVGNQVTYGERVSDIARNRAAKDEDWVWLAQINAWARELYQIQPPQDVSERRLRLRRHSEGYFGSTLPIFVTFGWVEDPVAQVAVGALGSSDPGWSAQRSSRWSKDDLTRKEMEGILYTNQVASAR